MRLARLLPAIALGVAATSPFAADGPARTTLASSDDAAIRDLETRSWVAWKNHDS